MRRAEYVWGLGWWSALVPSPAPETGCKEERTNTVHLTERSFEQTRILSRETVGQVHKWWLGVREGASPWRCPPKQRHEYAQEGNLMDGYRKYSRLGMGVPGLLEQT